MPERARADHGPRALDDASAAQALPARIPMTRREARLLEAREAAAESTGVAHPEAADRRARSRTSTPRRPRRHRRSTVGKRLLSLGALTAAGAIAFGMSVPANAFIDAERLAAELAERGAVTAAAPVIAHRVQSLEVPDEVVPVAAERDSFGTLSYAEMLRLKYADVDYSFAATMGAIRWPFPYTTTISDGWGDREGGFHKGVDFTPGGGAPIYAIADGIATTVDNGSGVYGTHVRITHTINGQRVESLYAHMQESSTPIVQGQAIKVGDFLGLVGDTGLSFGAHLHLEIHVDSVPVDPFAWLTANAV